MSSTSQGEPPSAMVVAAKRARRTALRLAQLSTENKNALLRKFQSKLREHKAKILAENELDVRDAQRLADQGQLSQTLVRRLGLGGSKFDTLLEGIEQVIALEDPVGKCTYANELTKGLQLYRVTCPIGVMCVIFEARPEACVQIASLALKSGNALLLKGGKEASRSNRILVETLQIAVRDFVVEQETKSKSQELLDKDAAEGVLQLLEAREEVAAILKMDSFIDLVVPRGGNALVRYIKNNTLIPVLGHADGICAAYVDAEVPKSGQQPKGLAKNGSCEKNSASTTVVSKNDPTSGLHAASAQENKTFVGEVLLESKTGYVSACNAAETLLLHASHCRGERSHDSGGVLVLKRPSATASTSSSSTVVEEIIDAFAGWAERTKQSMEFRCDPLSKQAFEKALQIRKSNKHVGKMNTTKDGEQLLVVKDATPADYDTEFLDYVLAVKTVGGVEEAIAHINEHGSKHTDLILTASQENCETFMQGVDSADVFHNCSTRFADGFRFGFGAEIGISTNRIHSRGPVGLEGLVLYKYRLYSDQGHCVATTRFDHARQPHCENKRIADILEQEHGNSSTTTAQKLKKAKVSPGR
ncbi:unnamed protein product [Amoebophrya sp. A120]|nr:unnamed protein product [Amoebophrya sp. A120]|eukprot:GSA120T00018020001.1